MENRLLSAMPAWTAFLPPSQRDRFGNLLGHSLVMRQLFALLERVAACAVPVLLEGESGTGKELAAQGIHTESDRASRPFVICHCGAIPRELAESELFGHKRGAFTGATLDRPGLFRRAHGGTIFLDEIGELPLELQPKLLRVLESGEVRGVGEDTAQRVDVRVVAATNRDLDAEARRGAFRADLLYRLNVLRVRMPPLRQRLEDLELLVLHLAGEQVDPIGPIDGPNLERLLGHDWPGNVRELRNVLMHAVAITPVGRGVKPRFSELLLGVSAPTAPSVRTIRYPGVLSPLPFKEAKEQLLASFERAYLEALLARHGGVVSHAARTAGLSRRHLHELIQRRLGLLAAENDAAGTSPAA